MWQMKPWKLGGKQGFYVCVCIYKLNNISFLYWILENIYLFYWLFGAFILPDLKFLTFLILFSAWLSAV